MKKSPKNPKRIRDLFDRQQPGNRGGNAEQDSLNIIDDDEKLAELEGADREDTVNLADDYRVLAHSRIANQKPGKGSTGRGKKPGRQR